MGTAVHSQQLGAHVVRFCSTTELMCFWVSLTRFTSGRSGIAVPRPRESLYFIYPNRQFGFHAKKVKSRSVRGNFRKAETRHSTKNSQQTLKHGIKHTFFFFFPEKWRSRLCWRHCGVKLTPRGSLVLYLRGGFDVTSGWKHLNEGWKLRGAVMIMCLRAMKSEVEVNKCTAHKVTGSLCGVPC